MSLYSEYFLAGKPGTAGEGLKRSTKELKLAIYGVLHTPVLEPQPHKCLPRTILEWLAVLDI